MSDRTSTSGWVRDWFRTMRTIIVLLCVAPCLALVIADGPSKQAVLLSQVLSLGALVVGFPVDWWRLQRRKRTAQSDEKETPDE